MLTLCGFCKIARFVGHRAVVHRDWKLFFPIYPQWVTIKGDKVTVTTTRLMWPMTHRSDGSHDHALLQPRHGYGWSFLERGELSYTYPSVTFDLLFLAPVAWWKSIRSPREQKSDVTGFTRHMTYTSELRYGPQRRVVLSVVLRLWCWVKRNIILASYYT